MCVSKVLVGRLITARRVTSLRASARLIFEVQVFLRLNGARVAVFNYDTDRDNFLASPSLVILGLLWPNACQVSSRLVGTKLLGFHHHHHHHNRVSWLTFPRLLWILISTVFHTHPVYSQVHFHLQPNFDVEHFIRCIRRIVNKNNSFADKTFFIHIYCWPPTLE